MSVNKNTSGKINFNNTISGKIEVSKTNSGKIASGGSTDHSRLFNRDLDDQHPISAITGLQEVLDELDESKLDSKTALPLITSATKGVARGLYYDALSELAKKPYWYVTSEIDSTTKMGTKSSIISGPYNLGQGGGSGSGSSGSGGITTVSLKPYGWPSNAIVGGSTKINITWSSSKDGEVDSSITGTIYLTINDKQVTTKRNQKQGIIEFDISDYIISGDNTIQFKILDMYGTTGITIGVINGVALSLESDFDSSKAFEKDINYTYNPIGNISKLVHFLIDGEEKATKVVTVSNETQTYTLSGLSHGAHTLEVYFTVTMDDEEIESNHLFYDLLCVTPGNTTPIIASDFKDLEQEQYLSFNIPYQVYIYGRSQAAVSLSVNGTEIRKYDVNTSDVHLWSYKSDIAGTFNLTISCEGVSKTFNVHIVESSVKITPVEEGLALALSAHGRSNNENEDERATWSYTNSRGETYNCKFTNFNWSSDGWILDSDDNNILSVGGDARLEIPIEVFKNDFKANGKTIELEIATRNIRDYDTTIISCLDNQTSSFYEVESLLTEEDTREKGFSIKYNYSVLQNAGISLGKNTFEYDGTSWTLNDNKVNLNDYGITLEEVTINIEGDDLGVVLKGDKITVTYEEEARGFQITPQVATIRSQQSLLSTQYKEDEHIRIAFVVEQIAKDRIIWMYINGVASGAMQYPTDDTFVQLSPSIIKVGSSEAIVDIYNIRIYNNSLTNKQIVNNWLADMQDQSIRLTKWQRNNILDDRGEVLMESLPTDLPYIIWDIDPLPEFKGDKRLGDGRYVELSHPERNFTVVDAEYNVQGTSSSVYPVKNIRMRMRSKNSANYAWYDDDGNTIEDFSVTYPSGIGANYFTFKVDYASSEGANNVELVRLYNDAAIDYGIMTPPQYQQYSQWNNKEDITIRTGIDGYPIVAFHQAEDGTVKFWTKANFNNDKANEDVYGFAEGDESWETTNNSATEGKYQVPATLDNFDRGFEIRFPDQDGYNDLSKLGPMTAWVYSTYRDLATNEALPEKVTFTYKESIQSEGGSFSTTTVTKEFTHDTSEYRLAKFKAELADWFNVDSCLFYYLYTELFLMIDSRAKNAFPTYFATRTNTLVGENTYDDGGNRWFWIPYDMDTAIGIDNKGKLTFDYYLEDTDTLDGADVFNGQDSVMWCNIRDAFRGELAEMYAELRNKKLISYDHVNELFEEHQNKWPEVILNLDSQNKYISPLQDGDNYLEMLQGTKEQQRKWWLYNRFKYIDSKYNAGEAVKDFIQFRAYVNAGVEKPDLTIVPYANIYATASFGNGSQYIVSQRVKNRNEAITLKNPFGLLDNENDQETYIYSASQLKSIGDISGFHPDTVKIGNAIRLQELKVGDSSAEYSNPYLKELTIGANTLLRKIDARNCINLGTGTTVAPDLSQCTNIEEIYFSGTKIKGINLPDGGSIKTLHLPGTLVSLTIKNQPLLNDLVIDNTNTSISNGVYSEGGHAFNGLVIKKDSWNATSANADIYLADTPDSEVSIRISIIDKDLYDNIEENSSILNVVCSYIDARFDLINKKEIQLFEYSTRMLKSTLFNNTAIPNVTEYINSVKSSIQVPTLKDFSASLIERLWLEGIPSSSINAKELIENMAEGTEVRLIGINETYDSWKEIEEFYNLLDTHYGINLNDSDEKVKAQVTGTIHVDSIPYKNYISLSERYSEVIIDAKQIICTVVFMNEAKIHETRNVVLGNTVELPATPVKISTQAHYYDFEYWTYNNGQTWTNSIVVNQDLTIDAVFSEHLQRYEVQFNSDSDIISVNPQSVIKEYGSVIEPPETFDVPEGVTLSGWYNNGTRWDFETDKVLDNITLVAKWIDHNTPDLNIKTINYKTIYCEATDNLGITAWAVQKDTSNAPTTWTTITSTTSFNTQYEIDSAGDYYVWVSDSNGNTDSQKLTAYSISVNTTPGITNYTFSEAEDASITTFAFSNTELKLDTEIDDHYENLNIFVNGNELKNKSTFIVNKNISVDLSCTPKNYIVSFNLFNKGDQAKAPSQLITYLHKAEKPLAQYYQTTGEVIDSWYKDELLTKAWNFNSDIITEDIILYAKWVSYIDPTVVTINIPEGDEEARTITLCYSQKDTDDDHKVTVDWGDSSEIASSDDNLYVTHLVHTYEIAGEYKISILGTGGNTKATYTLGDGWDWQIVTPSTYITDIEFAWDIAKVAQYALKGSNIKDAKISDYMTEISTGCYANCKNIECITLPENILIIGDQAFSGCENAAGHITIPKNIQKIGHNAFDGCSNITKFTLLCNTTPELYTYICRGCSSLTSFEISEHLNIPNNMFSSCTGLVAVNLKNKEVGDYAFYNCTGLQSLTSSSEYFGTQAFSRCTNLEKVILTNKNLIFSSYVFNACPKLNEFGPLNIENPEYDFNYSWDTKLPDYAFQRSWDEDSRKTVKSVILPDTLKEIGTLAFHNATQLSKINLPQGLEVIGEQAFESCIGLNKITIPNSVLDIKPKAFAGCSALIEAYIKALSSVTKIDTYENAWFLNANKSMKLYVPASIFTESTILADYYGPYWNVQSYVRTREDEENPWVYSDIIYFDYQGYDYDD